MKKIIYEILNRFFRIVYRTWKKTRERPFNGTKKNAWTPIDCCWCTVVWSPADATANTQTDEDDDGDDGAI